MADKVITPGATGRVDEQRKGKRSLLLLPLTILTVTVVVAVPYFSVFIPQTSYVAAAAVLLLLAAFLIQDVKSGTRIVLHVSLALLGVFYAYVVINGYDWSSLGWLIVFGLLAAASLLLACEENTGWPKHVLKCIAVFGSFYGIATIVLWVVPQLYSFVYPFLISRTSAVTISGEGYKAGLTTHYSTNGIYIALGFLAASAFAMGYGHRWIGIAGILLFALLLTTKRAHLSFSVAAFCITYLLFNPRRKLDRFGKLLVCGTLVLLALYILSFFNEEVLEVFERFASISDDDSLGGRSDFYDLCIEMWLGNPLFGNGWGSFSDAFSRTAAGANTAAQGYSEMTAHNVFLQLLAEEGLVGCGIFIITLAMGIIAAARRLTFLGRKAAVVENPGALTCSRVVIAGSLSIQLFFTMYCATGNPLYDMQMYVPYLLAVAMPFTVSHLIEISSDEGTFGCDKSMFGALGR